MAKRVEVPLYAVDETLEKHAAQWVLAAVLARRKPGAHVGKPPPENESKDMTKLLPEFT